MSQTRLAYIDSLRGWAILGVVAVHAALSVEAPMSTWVYGLAAWGSRGVQLFFMLSALTLLVVSQNRLLEYSAFYLRRFFRVAPMFYLGAVLYVCIWYAGYGAPGEGMVTLSNFLLTLSFFHVWSFQAYDSIVPGGWSIGCEAMSYILFPLMLIYLNTLTRAVAALGLSILLAIALIKAIPLMMATFGILAADRASFDSFIRFTFIYNLPAFLCGATLFHLLKDENSIYHTRKIGIASACLSVVVMLALALPGTASLRNSLIACFPLSLFVFGVAISLPRIAVNDIMNRLGIISFSVYVLHFAVLKAVKAAFGRYEAMLPADLAFLAYFAIALVISCILASLTYRFIEKPFVAMGHRISKKQSS